MIRLATLFILFTSCVANAQSVPIDQFVNPIGEGADPWVVSYRKADSDPLRYLWCLSEGNRAIAIHTSDRLTSLGTKHIVWRAPESGPVSREVWAPELHLLDGRWHVYFAASDGRNENHLAYVLRSETDDPLSTYQLHGPFSTGDGSDGRSPNLWAIDMTVLEVNNVRYAIWSGWDRAGSDQQYLYIAPMKSPVELASTRVRLCANDDYLWERVQPGSEHRGLNEAPQVWQPGDRTFVAYSCGASWLPTYKLGLLELKVGADPMNPNSWRKHSQPVFQSDRETMGVGHSCFVRSPDASQWWHVFHAKRDPNPGWRRAIFVQRMRADSDGAPRFDAPVQPGTLMKRPSGESITAANLPLEPMQRSSPHRDAWSYYGHHQFYRWVDDQLILGEVPTDPINAYRSGEKMVLDRLLPNDLRLEVEIDFDGDSSSRDAGVVFRCSGASIGYDAQRGYFAGLIPKTGLVILGKTDGRRWTELARAPAQFDTAKPQRLEVTVVGPAITVTFQEEAVIQVTDDTYTKGTVGLRVVDTNAAFSDLRISDPSSSQPSAPPRPLR